MFDQNQKIPSSWKKTTFGQVSEIIGGGTPRTDTPEYWNGEIPWLSVVDFNDGRHWVYGTEKTITNEGLANSSTRLLNPGDLIVSARGTVGAFAQLKVPMAFNQSCYGLRAKKDSENNFLYYLLQQSIQQIKRNVHGAVFDTITRDTFDQITVNVPPLSEQQAISEVLLSLDNKIELLREQNKTLEATAQTIFKEWFINFNFPGATGKMIDSELGPIPNGWKVGKLGEIITLFDSKRVPLASDVRAKRLGRYPYYGATSIMDYIDDYLFDGTYLLLAEDGSVIDKEGYPIMQYVWGKFWVSNHSHVLQGKNGFSTEMLFVLLKKTNISGIVNGAVQLKINQTNLINFKVLIPSSQALKQFDNILQPIFGKVKNIDLQIKTLSNIRDNLLPKLMKGEIRVKGFKQESL